jgi:hypothetical protein
MHTEKQTLFILDARVGEIARTGSPVKAYCNAPVKTIGERLPGFLAAARSCGR